MPSTKGWTWRSGCLERLGNGQLTWTSYETIGQRMERDLVEGILALPAVPYDDQRLST